MSCNNSQSFACTSNDSSSKTTSLYETSQSPTQEGDFPPFQYYDYNNGGWLSDQLEQMYQILRASQWTTNIYLTIFLSLIFIFGLGGNILVLIVFTKSKIKQASTILIMGLAANDLIICVIVLPGVLLKEWYVPFQWDSLCRGWEWVRCATIPLSSLVLLVIGVDRYILICHVGQVRPMSVRHAKYTLLLAAVVSSCHGILPMMRVGVYQADAGSGTVYLGLCLGNDLLVGQDIIDHYWQAMAVEFTLILIVVVVMYCLVFRTVYLQNKRWPNVLDHSPLVLFKNKTAAKREANCQSVHKADAEHGLHPAGQSVDANENVMKNTSKGKSFDCSDVTKVVKLSANHADNQTSYSKGCQDSVSELHKFEPVAESQDLAYLTALRNTEVMMKGSSFPEGMESVFTVTEHQFSQNPTANQSDLRDVNRPNIMSLYQNENRLATQATIYDKLHNISNITQHATSSDELNTHRINVNNGSLETTSLDTDGKVQNMIKSYNVAGCSYAGNFKSECSHNEQNHNLHKEMTDQARSIPFTKISTNSSVTKKLAAWDNPRTATVSCKTLKQCPRAVKKSCDRRIHPISEVNSSSRHQGSVILQGSSTQSQQNKWYHVLQKLWQNTSYQKKGKLHPDKIWQKLGKQQQEHDKQQQKQGKQQQEHDKQQQQHDKQQQQHGKQQQEHGKQQQQHGKQQQQHDEQQQQHDKQQQQHGKQQQQNGKQQQQHDKQQQQQGKQQQQSKTHQEASPQKRYSAAQVKTAKVLLLVTAVYVISFAPVLLMILGFIPSHPIPFYGYFIHSAANPLIYSFINQAFRMQLQKLLSWKRKI